MGSYYTPKYPQMTLIPAGFPQVCDNQIPWVFPEISLRKFQNSLWKFNDMDGGFGIDLSEVQWTGQGHGAAKANMEAEYKISNKFPEFSLSFCIFTQFPVFFLSGKQDPHSPCSPCCVGTLTREYPLDYHYLCIFSVIHVFNVNNVRCIQNLHLCSQTALFTDSSVKPVLGCYSCWPGLVWQKIQEPLTHNVKLLKSVRA